MSTVIKALLALGIIAFMIKSGTLDLDSFAQILDVQFVALGLVLVAFNLTIINERWRVLLRSQQIFTTFWGSIKMTFIGLFFNYVIPGGVGGDFVKVYYVVKDNPDKKAISGMSIVLDRILGLFSMLLMVVLILNFRYDLVAQNQQLLILHKLINLVFLGFLVALIFLFKVRLDKWTLPNKLKSLYEAAHVYGKNPMVIFKVILLSLIAQLFAIAVFYLVGLQLGESIPLAVYFFIIPIGFIVTAVPIAPAGIGVGQMAFHFLFKTYSGGNPQIGPLGITALQIFQFFYALIGAWFFMRRKESLKEVESAV